MMATMLFRIGDIHCIGCLNRITYALKNENAIEVDINLENKIAKVTTGDEGTTKDSYLDAIKKAGYSAEWLATLDED